MNKKEMRTIAETLGNTIQLVLGEGFTVQTNVHIAQLTYDIPVQIIGPTGIWILDLVTEKGMFSYQEDTLYQVLPGRRLPKYKKTKHTKRIRGMLSAISSVLGSTDKKPKGVFPAFLFVAPESSIKRDNAPIPLISLIDLAYFCENIGKRNQIFDEEKVALIRGRLLPEETEANLASEDEDGPED